jgi:dihydrofolate reductase
MRRVVVTEFLTLDGVMEAPGGEFHPDGKGGWTFPFFTDEAGKFKFDELFAADALLLGRVTYEHFAAAWPSMTDEAGFADRMNSLPKFVASTTLREPLEWNATLIEGDLADEVSKLKLEDGQDILVLGSADLVHTLLQHDLIDEFRLMVFPVILGSGKRLFRDGIASTPLRLVETTTFKSGVAVLSYALGAGEHE